MHNLRSTFPLDEAAIVRSAIGRVLADPITWVPLVPVVAAYSIFDVPGMIVSGLGGGVMVGLGVFWRGQWGNLTETLRRKMIREHNRAQNTLLASTAGELRLSGAHGEARQLDEFIELKKQVEQRLHEKGEITPQRVQLEQLVDSLCFGVRDQLCLLAHQRKQGHPVDPVGILTRVATALATLEMTLAELDTILSPADPLAGSAGGSLEEITRRLREEAEIARRVQARLRQPEAAAILSESRGLESE